MPSDRALQLAEAVERLSEEYATVILMTNIDGDRGQRCIAKRKLCKAINALAALSQGSPSDSAVAPQAVSDTIKRHLQVVRRVLVSVTDEEWVPINSSLAGACGVAVNAIDSALSGAEGE